MFTQTTVMFYSFGAGVKTPDKPLQILMGDRRYEPLIQNEIQKIQDGLPTTVKDWRSFESSNLIEALKVAEHSWKKLVNTTSNAQPWHMDDLTAALDACDTALWILSGTKDELAEHTHQGPVQKGCHKMSQVAITQHMLHVLCDAAEFMITQLLEEFIPMLRDGLHELRARMGQVDIGTLHHCMKCNKEFDGAEGLVVHHAPRGREKGVVCLPCFGY